MTQNIYPEMVNSTNNNNNNTVMFILCCLIPENVPLLPNELNKLYNVTVVNTVLQPHM